MDIYFQQYGKKINIFYQKVLQLVINTPQYIYIYIYIYIHTLPSSKIFISQPKSVIFNETSQTLQWFYLLH